MAPPNGGTSSIIRRRNNGVGGNNNPQQRKRCAAYIARAFYIAIIVAAASLSALTVSMARDFSEKEAMAAAASSSSSSSKKRVLGKNKKGVTSAPNVASSANDGNDVVPAHFSSKTDRVYCMVPFIWNEEFYHTIMETWGKRCDVIRFLTDSIVGGKLAGDKITDDPLRGYKPYTEYPPGTFPDNVVFVNMTRSWNDCVDKSTNIKKVCRHIWEKMWRSWVHVDDHDLDKADWFCKVDYDTYFFPDNVKHYVREQQHWDAQTEHHYFGHMIEHRQAQLGRENMIAGAAACWSAKTLHAAAEVYRDMPKGWNRGERNLCEDRSEASEEVTTSICLKRHLNISAHPARDPQLREYITLAKYKDVLTWNRTKQGEWWFWKGKPPGAGEEEECCAVRPIGLHKYKTPWEVRELEEQFFGKPDNKVLKKLDARTKRYVTKVRKAMGVE